MASRKATTTVGGAAVLISVKEASYNSSRTQLNWDVWKKRALVGASTKLWFRTNPKQWNTQHVWCFKSYYTIHICDNSNFWYIGCNIILYQEILIRKPSLPKGIVLGGDCWSSHIHPCNRLRSLCHKALEIPWRHDGDGIITNKLIWYRNNF